MDIIWAFLLIGVSFVCWGITLVGMPGNWLMAAAAALYFLVGPTDGRLALGGVTLILLVLLAVLGEVTELLAGSLWVSKAGGSRCGAVLALFGAMIGGLIGFFVGSLGSVVGALVATLFLAAFGALAGAMTGETWKGRRFQESWEIGKAAFWGRLLGTFAKTMIGAVMITVVAAALVAM